MQCTSTISKKAQTSVNDNGAKYIVDRSQNRRQHAVYRFDVCDKCDFVFIISANLSCLLF